MIGEEMLSGTNAFNLSHSAALSPTTSGNQLGSSQTSRFFPGLVPE
jgi:hypothetical protein